MYLAKPKPRGCDAGKCGSSASCRLASRHVGKRTRVGVYLPDPVALALGEIALVQQTRVLTLTRYTRREWTSGITAGARRLITVDTGHVSMSLVSATHLHTQQQTQTHSKT